MTTVMAVILNTVIPVNSSNFMFAAFKVWSQTSLKMLDLNTFSLCHFVFKSHREANERPQHFIKMFILIEGCFCTPLKPHCLSFLIYPDCVCGEESNACQIKSDKRQEKNIL